MSHRRCQQLWRSVPLAEGARLGQRLSEVADKLRVLLPTGIFSSGQEDANGAPNSEVAQLRRQYVLVEKEVQRLAVERERALRRNPAQISVQSVQQSFSTTQLHVRVMFFAVALRSRLIR